MKVERGLSLMADSQMDITTSFTVQEVTRSIVKAPTNSPDKSYTLTLSNFDQLSGRYPITIFYVYSSIGGEFSSVLSAVKISLAEILAYYQPFAGRIRQNHNNGEDEILCNNEGVEFVVAAADVPLSAVDYHQINESASKILLPTSFSLGFLVSVQVTSFSCGGCIIAWSFDHLLGDAATFTMFITSWAELSRTKILPTAMIPNHDRSVFRRPRSPPTYCASLDDMFMTCNLNQISLFPMKDDGLDVCLKRLYFVKASSLERLRYLASLGGVKRTRTQAFSAYLWKTLADCAWKDHQKCKMGWLVDGRRRINAGDGQLPLSNYCGNLVSMAAAVAGVTELKEKQLSEVATMAAEAINNVANEDHFVDMMDWIECKRPSMVLAKILMGDDMPGMVVNSCHHLPVMSADFGYGTPVIGTFYTTMAKFGVGTVNMISSGRGDGSWFVFALVWPALAAALESGDILRPVHQDYLHFSEKAGCV